MNGIRFAKWITVACLVTCLPTSVRSSSGSQDASPASEDGVSTGLDRVKAQALSGQAQAQIRLAEHYRTAADFTNAVVWYRKAAVQGDVAAQLALASFHLAGQGTERDPAEAARLLRAAASRLEVANPEAKSSEAPKAQAATPPSSASPPMPRVQRVLKVQAPPAPRIESPPLQLTRATR